MPALKAVVSRLNPLDCDDLCSYRIADLRVKSVPTVQWNKYHIMTIKTESKAPIPVLHRIYWFKCDCDCFTCRVQLMMLSWKDMEDT